VTQLPSLIQSLANGGVEFILIGGVAATAHGSARLTQDVDAVYSRTPENLRRLAEALAPFKPYLRGAPPGLPFRWDVATLERGLNFTLTTELGPLDLLGEIPGGGTYLELEPGAIRIRVFEVDCLCLSLKQLIRSKRAAGRPKDLEALAELEALADEGGDR
jgi:predicted nucleotidyltransferase